MVHLSRQLVGGSAAAALVMLSLPAVAVVGNVDRVDGRHAVGAASAKTARANKLVATNRNGVLPNNIITKAVDADRLDGLDASAFLPIGGTALKADSATTAVNADRVDGVEAANLLPGGTLPPGTTIRGTYALTGHAPAAGALVLTPISYGYRLPGYPTVVVVPPVGPPPAACPGTPLVPEAKPGTVCVFAWESYGLYSQAPDWVLSTRDGLVLRGTAGGAGEFYSIGSWAVSTN